ncbi:MAG: NnrS family protein [Candidatus Latescibacteria bacterium]|jgi:uncharacterized protein involved in response to NO|nr:NnrS family protein [Candidatus Latescibacterota bacterium]
MSTPASNATPRALDILCDEPFRIFFPLGLLCSLIGVSHWLWYYSGLIETFSCTYHGLLQMQGFQTAFAVGFLMTALPRFMEVPGARPWELALGVGLFICSFLGLYLEDWVLAEVGFLALILHITIFALRRFRRRRDTPPVAFLFIPFGLLHAFVGGLLILWRLQGFVKLGHRLVEQGMVLCFVMGIGAYLGPRLMGLVRPDTEAPGSSRLKAALFILAGISVFASFWIETALSEPSGRLLRALVVGAILLTTVRIFRLPRRPLWHLRGLWLSFWCVILGQLLSGVFPDYEVAALHVTFIGGLALLTLTIATRVTVSHCGFEPLWERNSTTLILLVACSVAALLARLSAALYPDHYFGWLHIGAGIWLVGAIPWGAVFLPKLSPRHVSDDD